MQLGASGNWYRIIGPAPKFFWQTDPAKQLIKSNERRITSTVSSHPNILPRDEKWNVYINYLHTWINEFHQVLGISVKKRLDPNKVIFRKQTQKKGNSAGLYMANDGIILVNPENSTEFRLMKSLLHEAVHFYSRQVFLVDRRNNSLRLYRTGYGVTDRSDSKTVYFRAFNEGIVDITVLAIYHHHEDEITKLFKFTPQQKHEDVRWIGVPYEIVREIIRQHSYSTGIHEAVITQALIRNQFTGNLSFLRFIDKQFGKGTLRILGKLGCRITTPPEVQYEMMLCIRSFVGARSDKERTRHKQRLSEFMNLNLNSN